MNRSAVLSVEAALLALVFDSSAFAAFGPAFEYGFGLALFTLAFVSGAAAILFAHRAGHALRRNPGGLGESYATMGSILGWVALLIASGYIGLLYLLFHPLVAVVAATLGATAFAIHLDGRVAEDEFRRTWNHSEGTAACLRCRRIIPFSVGHWQGHNWLCPACVAYPWGVPR
jgi:hypothetical protein